jgi:allantoinase
MSVRAIKSNRIITGKKIISGVLIIENGIILDILPAVPEGDLFIHDAGNHVIMPGIIDPHVHINEPGRTSWEGFDTATRAAMAGGVTSMIEMPLNASPVTTDVTAFDMKLAAAKNKLHVNCGFWGGIIPGNEKEIEPLVEKGVFGFKAFLTHSGIDEFPNVCEDDLRKVMPLLAKHNVPLLVHCEIDDTLQQDVKDPRSYHQYLLSRPDHWEVNAVALMARLCEEFNCRTHIVHLSSANSLPIIRQAKEKGLPLTAETAQHYLYFNAESIPDGRTEFKCAPPIRSKKNNDLLWEALKEGVIDFVATDHSPAPPEMKQIQSGNLSLAWGGISSIQFSLPALWSAAQRHNCTIIDIAEWLCEKPALLPSLNNKGLIKKGYDADLVAWDPDKRVTIQPAAILHRHPITPYNGESLTGWPVTTWLGGEKIYEDGKLIKFNQGMVLLR